MEGEGVSSQRRETFGKPPEQPLQPPITEGGQGGPLFFSTETQSLGTSLEGTVAASASSIEKESGDLAGGKPQKEPWAPKAPPQAEWREVIEKLDKKTTIKTNKDDWVCVGLVENNPSPSISTTLEIKGEGSCVIGTVEAETISKKNGPEVTASDTSMVFLGETRNGPSPGKLSLFLAASAFVNRCGGQIWMEGGDTSSSLHVVDLREGGEVFVGMGSERGHPSVYIEKTGGKISFTDENSLVFLDNFVEQNHIDTHWLDKEKALINQVFVINREKKYSFPNADVVIYEAISARGENRAFAFFRRMVASVFNEEGKITNWEEKLVFIGGLTQEELNNPPKDFLKKTKTTKKALQEFFNKTVKKDRGGNLFTRIIDGLLGRR